MSDNRFQAAKEAGLFVTDQQAAGGQGEEELRAVPAGMSREVNIDVTVTPGGGATDQQVADDLRTALLGLKMDTPYEIVEVHVGGLDWDRGPAGNMAAPDGLGAPEGDAYWLGFADRNLLVSGLGALLTNVKAFRGHDEELAADIQKLQARLTTVPATP